MLLAKELHISGVYFLFYAQGLFMPSKLCIRVRKIALHDENAVF